MASDAWGIDGGYEDAHQVWRETDTATRSAILKAMGVGEDSAPPLENAVQIVRQGSAPRPFQTGKLVLEDGGVVQAAGRLPKDLPMGYHTLWPADEAVAPIRVIVTPCRCVLPGDGEWGWAAQLYAARSAESWGMGDLADLRRLARWSAGQEAKLLLLNPLSAATPSPRQQASPYYPSSRRFLNPLYLRVEEVPGASLAARELEELAAAGHRLNAERLIDRNAVFELKQRALQTIWERWSPNAAFEHFCAQQGDALRQFGSFCVLSELFGPNWRQWPAEYQRVDAPAVAQFADEHRARVRYHQWLQWLLDEQIGQAAREIGLVQDLSIGIDPGGADAWVWRDLLAEGCSVGAPPDLYNTQGQDWGLPPFVPHKLRQAGYEPFVQTLRAALRHAGGLRIDHVMGLFRLYWIPNGFGAARGAFVRYRADEMLAIVALESVRAGAFVVGEDLGTVEDGAREQLAAHQVLSYRVLWFEDEPPSTYPKLSMAAATTHDLPTVAGLWSGHDLAAQHSLGLSPNDAALKEVRNKLASLADLDETARMDTVVEASYRLLSTSRSMLATASLDDALAVTERPNMPNTIDQWPNWSLALPGGIEAIEKSPLADKIAAAMRTRCKRAAGRSPARGRR
ncbi:MAG TPA: 4-alpha-glucanotransferase [Pirellulales bacterium]|nr:4-alpha-glucanotransferase [Pirellulales bacterium]